MNRNGRLYGSFALILLFFLFPFQAQPQTRRISRADYEDRVRAIWTGQMAAGLMAMQFEHATASIVWISDFPEKRTTAPVDDDWYYEMCALRAFEKYGVRMTVEELGRQWLENNCGSWGSSKQARLNLQKGVPASRAGHPLFNKLWFTIGAQFSSDIYGALAPGMPNVAGRMAREYGHINSYAEGTDGAVFVAGMISAGFFETDPRETVRKAALLIHPDSPYRKCLEMVMAMAESGRRFEEVVSAVEDRWHAEYPATNNAVANGGIVAAAVWFGEGEFLKTVNLAARAADFTDADCNAANAASVVGAMHGMKALPQGIVAQFGDRIRGNQMGGIPLTPAVDETISGLAKRTANIGEQVVVAEGGSLSGAEISVPVQPVSTQPAELFVLSDLMQYWNPDWKLERAGFGGGSGGLAGIHGMTFLDGDVLATFPRDEVRGALLRRTVRLSAAPKLSLQAGADAGRAWLLEIYADNDQLLKQVIEGAAGGERSWKTIAIDLLPYAGKEVVLRIYQRVLFPDKVPGNAYWRNIQLK